MAMLASIGIEGAGETGYHRVDAPAGIRPGDFLLTGCVHCGGDLECQQERYLRVLVCWQCGRLYEPKDAPGRTMRVPVDPVPERVRQLFLPTAGLTAVGMETTRDGVQLTPW